MLPTIALLALSAVTQHSTSREIVSDEVRMKFIGLLCVCRLCAGEAVRHADIAGHLHHTCRHHRRLLRADCQRHLASVVVNYVVSRRRTSRQTPSESHQDTLVHLGYDKYAVLHDNRPNSWTFAEMFLKAQN